MGSYGKMRSLAVRLAKDAGDFAVAESGAAIALPKGEAGDVVTYVDLEAERRIVAGIRAEYPDHSIFGEESGQHGNVNAEFRWLIDPLDGTNNYVLGLASYGVCITVCRAGTAIAAVVHDSSGGHSYAATAGGGAFVNGRSVLMTRPGRLSLETVSMLQGYSVQHDDARRVHISSALNRSCKRVLRTWSPSIDWGLVASGRVPALIAYRNDEWDLVGGALIACEAGAEMRTSADGEVVVVSHPNLIDELCSLVLV
jgi:myo-inositol-1(or 4)-monophosphatase